MYAQIFRLWPRRPLDGSLPLGLTCDEAGLSLAGSCDLIEPSIDGAGRRTYRARSVDAIGNLLGAAYGDEVDPTDLRSRLLHIAVLMSGGQWTRATIATLHLRLPELANLATAAQVVAADDLFKWNPALHPRWPQHSDQGHGGEFRPRGSNVVSVGDPDGDPNELKGPPDKSRAARLERLRRDRKLFKSLRRLGLITILLGPALDIADNISETIDVINTLEDITPELQRSLDPPKELDELRADKEFRSFPSFDAFKRYYGPAGEGYEWHHIVEQSADFPREKLNTTENIIRVPKFIHEEINGIYSSTIEERSYTIRDMIQREGFGTQREFGLQQLRNLGVIK